MGLEGGLRDEIPPVVNWEDSDNNFQRNFNEGEFTLSFDEFVKVDKPGEQIVVSPPLKYSLSPISRGKKVIFRFHPEEQLLENTTYSIQFGEAIQDITESNPINNLRYVFSTGNVIDSMHVRVRLRSRLDNKAVIGALVMLYETMSDTVIRTGRPIYFSKSDSSGLALIQNCKPGEYRIIALTDENRNYQLDLPGEQIGHIDSFISSTLSDSVIHQVLMYKEIEPPIQINAVKVDSQLIALTIDGDRDYLRWRGQDGEALISSWVKDTLFLFLNQPVRNIILESDYADPDTIKLSNLFVDKSTGNRFKQLEIGQFEAKVFSKILKLRTRWKNPITTIDEQKILIFDNTGNVVDAPNISVKRDSQELDLITFEWEHNNRRDSILFLPGAVSSWRSQNDTILKPLRVFKSESLSNLIVEVSDLNAKEQYIIQLRTAKGELLQKAIIKDVESFEWNISGLFPVKHQLTLITDLNRNGSADGGWFDTRQFPEPTISREIDNLRPDWDVQTSIKPQ